MREPPRPTRDRSVVAGDDGAATSLSLALLTPVLVVLAFAAVQAALWSHARTEARVVARDTAALVARSGASAADAGASAQAVLEATSSLSGVEVSVIAGGGIVTVTITADAPGIIRGTTAAVSVTESVPIEELTPR